MTPTAVIFEKHAAPQTPSAPGLVIVRVELTADDKVASEAVAARWGMTQIATLSRITEWFAGQSPDVQDLVYRDGDATRPILERMARHR